MKSFNTAFTGLFLVALGVTAIGCSSSSTTGTGTGSSSSSTKQGGTGGGTGCSGLSTCCSSVPSADQASCTALVGEKDDTACDQLIEGYQSAGYCSGLSTGGGSSSSSTTSGSGSCSTLSGCCSGLPAADTSSCQQLAGDNDESACAEAVTGFQAAGYCK